MVEPLVRPATEAEAGPIADLYIAFQREHNARFVRMVRLTRANRALMAEHFAKLVRNRQLWVVEAGGELAGFAAVSPNLPPLDLFYASATISDLYLRPAWRGRGWGRALLERVVADIEARGLHAVTISVQAGNPAAGLYEASGFRPLMRTLIRELAPGSVKTGPEYDG